MVEARALALTGALGSGYLESSLKRGLEWEPHVIGCDAGSTDPGPSSLGSGQPAFSRPAIKRDIRLGLLAARSAGVPLLIGSAGTAGSDATLAWTVEVVREIAREEDLHFKLAAIHSEQDKAYLKQRLAEGRIRPLRPAPHLDEAVIERSAHIVGMMGAEPFIRAIEQGAEVVIAGRSSDTSIFAAVPTMREADPALAWHAAKILECGAASVAQRKYPDCMFARIRADHFEVEPPNPEYVCTPLSVAAHTLYETANPFHLYEPSGMVDATDSTYEAATERSVRVRGTRFVPASTYTIKLEGAEFVGYQSIVLGGMRDPLLIGQIDDWIEQLHEKMRQRIGEMFGDQLSEDDYIFKVRVYGRNGVLGPAEPIKDAQPHELALVLEATAPTQDLASSIASSARHMALHQPIPEWKGLITTLALPYTPAHIERGPVYRFNLNHVVEPADPYEMFPMELERV
jgi:Acyclic terpene utilisation family protein AtuA